MADQEKSVTGEIPDFNTQPIPKAVMTAEVLGERNFRRYTKKDGTFCKDFEHFFDKDTGKFDEGGRIIYEPTMTKEQAQKFITDLCEKTGRTVVVDSLGGRPRAVPGWNLDIRVPGMGQSEQKAAAVPEGVMRERLNNQLLLDQRGQINELKETVAHLAAQLAPEEPTGKLEDGTIAQLRGLAKERNIDLGNLTLKADIITKIRAETERTNEGSIVNSQ